MQDLFTSLSILNNKTRSMLSNEPDEKVDRTVYEKKIPPRFKVKPHKVGMILEPDYEQNLDQVYNFDLYKRKSLYDYLKYAEFLNEKTEHEKDMDSSICMHEKINLGGSISV